MRKMLAYYLKWVFGWMSTKSETKDGICILNVCVCTHRCKEDIYNLLQIDCRSRSRIGVGVVVDSNYHRES